MSTRKQEWGIDLPLVLTILALLFFGVVMVYDASVVYAHDVFGGKYHFLILQAVWAIIGVSVAFAVSSLDYRMFREWAPLVMGLALITLVLVLIPGVGSKVQGARRWIRMGSIGFQPTELAKLGLVLYLSTWMTSLKQGQRGWSALGPFLVLLGVLVGLVMLQPDFGTAMILAVIGLTTYFISGASPVFFLAGLPALAAAALAFIWFSPYRRQRLLTFLAPGQSNYLTSGYHIYQVLVALGSGGLFGLGLGQSRQKYEYLPEVSGDSIFAIVGEEMGFVGAVLVVSLFMFLVYRGIQIAKQAPDDFGRLLAAGLTAWIGVQVFVNLAAMTGLLPLTGVPLPLISYGGSSLVVTLVGLGMLLSVSRG